MSKDKPITEIGSQDDLHFAIVASRYNGRYVDHLIERVRARLREREVPSSAIAVTRVPGANEIPYAASMLALTGDFDCVIALGMIIAGETPHHEIIANATAAAFQNIGIKTQVPVVNGVIVTLNEEQAEERVFGDTDRGTEFADTAIEMAVLGNKLADYLEELDKNDLERARAEELFGDLSIDEDSDDDNDFLGDSGGGKPFRKN